MNTLQFICQLHKHKVFILSGKLVHILTLVVFKQLGVVKDDDSYRTYLPVVFTKTSGSVKVLYEQAGIAHPAVAHAYMLCFAAKAGMSMITYENILCKFMVAHYGPAAKLLKQLNACQTKKQCAQKCKAKHAKYKQ